MKILPLHHLVPVELKIIRMPFLGSPLIHRAMSAEEGPRTVLCNQNRFVGILLVYSVERRSQIAVFTVEITEVLVETDYGC